MFNQNIVSIKSHLKTLSQVINIRKIIPTTFVSIPLATERVQAGFPSPAQDYIDKTLDLNEHLIKNVNATFIVKANSLSMINVGIDINDELIVDRSLEAKHRDIVIAVVDGDFTVKRLMVEESTWLKAENHEHADIHFNDGQSFEIWGVVTRVIKSFR